MTAQHNVPPSKSTDPLVRLKSILFRTPQVYAFNTRPADLEEALETVETILTGDYGRVIREAESLREEVDALTAERATVRAFFGVTE